MGPKAAKKDDKGFQALLRKHQALNDLYSSSKAPEKVEAIAAALARDPSAKLADVEGDNPGGALFGRVRSAMGLGGSAGAPGGERMTVKKLATLILETNPATLGELKAKALTLAPKRPGGLKTQLQAALARIAELEAAQG